ncbi:MAG: thiamine-monophosphate kinase [Bacteroidia bacterium]|nr:MAG: thiamine-monophosphate kinase [Bacteroidia bacterium]
MREADLIAKLTAHLSGRHPLLVTGIGDDAAVWEWNPQTYGLISTDTLHEHWDFDRVYHPAKYIGYKAATSALSDICAMNGEPLFLVVALGVPRYVSPAYLEALYDGLRQVEEKYGVAVIGGDISPARDLWLTVTVVGQVEKARITYRRGAQPTHLVCVTGDLGGAYAGLKILQREKAVFLQNPSIQPDISGFNYIVSRQLKPEARLDMVRRLRELGVQPSSMTDLSDGLAAGLHHLSTASQAAFHIYLDRLPFHEQTYKVAQLLDMPLSALLLYGGEEYELLFTAPVTAYERLQQEEQIHIIGFVKEGEGVWAEDSLGQVERVELVSWDSLLGRKDQPQAEGSS